MSLPTTVIGCSVEEWQQIIELSQSTRAKEFIKYIDVWNWDAISEHTNPTVVRQDRGFLKFKKWPHLNINRASLNKLCNEIFKVDFFVLSFYYLKNI